MEVGAEQLEEAGLCASAMVRVGDVIANRLFPLRDAAETSACILLESRACAT